MNVGILIMTLLLVINGLLAFTLGNILPGLLLLCGTITMMVLPRGRDRVRGLLGFVFAGCIFVSGAPIFGGGHAVTLLVTTVGAIHFLTWLLVYHESFDRPTFGVGFRNHDLLFTISFYSCLMLAYLALRMDVFPVLNDVSHQIGGVILVLLAFAVWELGRRSRLRRAEMAHSTTLPDRVTRICILLGLLVAAILLFRHPLPAFADGAVDFAEQLGLTYDPPDPPKQDGDPDEEPEDEPFAGVEHPLQSKPSSNQGDEGFDARGGPGSLPSRADLQPESGPRLQVMIEDPAVFERMVDQPIYVRLFTFETFDGGEWHPSPEPSRLINDADDGEEDGIVTLIPDRPNGIWHQVFVEQQIGDTLPALANLDALQLPQVERVREGTIRMPRDVRQFRARSTPRNFDNLVGEVLQAGRGGQHFHHVQVPSNPLMRDFEREIVRPITDDTEGLADQLLQLREYARNTFEYSLKIDNPDDLPPLENFLFHEKRGYCDFFASTGALMARMLGVPSRMAYGYCGGQFNAEQQSISFQGDDGHSWTEIFLEDYGWVVYDLTPPGEGAHTPAEEVTPEEQPEPAEVPQPEEEEEIEEPEMPEAPEVPEAPEKDFNFRDHWVMKNLDWILGGLLVVLIAIYVYRKTRKDSSKDGEDQKRARDWGPLPGYMKAYYELLDKLEMPYAEGDTLREMDDSLRERGVVGEEFEPMVHYHYRVRYEDGERAKDQERQFQRQIRDFIRQLPSTSSDQSESAAAY